MPAFEDEANMREGFLTLREVLTTLLLPLVATLAIVILPLFFLRTPTGVVLITPSNVSLSFPDIEASFGHRIPEAGIIGSLLAVNPSNACEPLQGLDAEQIAAPAFGLIERGNCRFVTKVQYAQDAGYAAAIVYNNEDDGGLVAMFGNGFDIEIPAVFISKRAGDILMQYARNKNARLYMITEFQVAAWSDLAVPIISVFAVSALLSAFFFIRRQCLRHTGLRHLPHELIALIRKKKERKVLPTVISNPKDNANPETCVICIEEYAIGEKLRMLPCNHEFHMPCIDQWLTTGRTFCPICKKDAHCKSVKTPSENTPLLSSVTRHMGSTVTSAGSSSPVVSETFAATSVHHSPGDIC